MRGEADRQKIWSLDELINQEVSEQGTVERAEFDAKVERIIREQNTKINYNL